VRYLQVLQKQLFWFGLEPPTRRSRSMHRRRHGFEVGGHKLAETFFNVPPPTQYACVPLIPGTQQGIQQ